MCHRRPQIEASWASTKSGQLEFVLHEAKAFFVTRAKRNTLFTRRYSHPVDRSGPAVLCNQTGVMTNYSSRRDYPTTLRRVVIKDQSGKRLVFLTNNFAL